jgi:hypothetical protein
MLRTNYTDPSPKLELGSFQWVLQGLVGEKQIVEEWVFARWTLPSNNPASPTVPLLNPYYGAEELFSVRSIPNAIHSQIHMEPETSFRNRTDGRLVTADTTINENK